MLFGTQDLLSGTISAAGARTGQPITATAISTNVIDLRPDGGGPATVDVGIVGVPIYLNVVVTETFNNATGVTISVESSAAAGLTSPTVHASKLVALAGLTAGTDIWTLALPADDYQRYLGLRYTVAGSAPTAGRVMAYLSHDQGGRNQHYPANR